MNKKLTELMPVPLLCIGQEAPGTEQSRAERKKGRNTQSMFAIVSVIVVLIISMVMVRIATVALILTGLSHESAKFQARSAFTGVGFTTTESEKVVNHPVRRRVLLLLMLVGNAGVVTAVASLILTFVNVETPVNWIWRLALLMGTLALLWFVATSNWINRHLTPLISWLLKRWTQVDVRDYARVLHLSGDYGIIELEVEPQDWLSTKKLRNLDLPQEGVLVLGIQRQDGRYLGAPKGETVVNPGDTLILYGRSPVLDNLDRRTDDSSGRWEHYRQVAEQQRVVKEQTEADQAT
jgi:hypothetical protein